MDKKLSSQELLILHIEEYRYKNRLNYHDLSSRLNLPYTTLSEILRGNRIPRLDTVDLISKAMGTTSSELLTPAITDARESVLDERILSATRKLSKNKRKLLTIYLHMLMECDFIDSLDNPESFNGENIRFED